jgi:PIN domain nuclease of toxin-antitoxin system
LNLLLDAHSLYWAIYEPEKLLGLARLAISDLRNKRFVSFATFWEMANKVAVDRLPLAGSSVEDLEKRIAQLDVTFLPITMAEIAVSATLPHHHADPFDRMLIAQAQAHDLTLVTKDEKISLYDVKILWR